ncbi:hypothetical protein N7472_011170 [Penicillium cf. griseofulvum]|uniref:Uncharacterized protein n=1 Tax=Penicillium cf. griseofulvum TaxID=2972120 RepID=A0A9W9LXH2_9EURO|nr:hypothetical protein N7472_011170 [Penicillium cf. griseofulvum]
MQFSGDRYKILSGIGASVGRHPQLAFSRSETRHSDLAPRRKDSPKRRHRSEVSCEDNIDDNADPGDRDYVHDSGDDPREISAIPHRTKRVRRAAAPRAARFSQHNAVRN